MMGDPCPTCGRIHPSNAARALGLFGPRNRYPRPVFRADYPSSPIRATRAEAEADWCAHHTTKEES